jgi:gentisate 1,2-dioxygenase
MDAFHQAMQAASCFALWERDTHEPDVEKPRSWPWRTMEPLITAAIGQTSMTTAERRVLVLSDPTLRQGASYGACGNLAVNLQVLMPGERARAHRHTMHALRFVLEGRGVTTIVEGKRCIMNPGDMILTPGWTWHEHMHEGTERSVWIDALDVPFQRYLKNGVFEPGPAHDVATLPADAAFSAAGFTPTATSAKPYSPMFRYPWEDAVRALAGIAPAADGSRRLRYTNPTTGGPVMSTIDCYLLALAAGLDTTAYRVNSNSVCVVIEGEGVTRIGDTRTEWRKHDVFTLPQGNWISHRAIGSNAKLFEISDREIVGKLGLLREEIAA